MTVSSGALAGTLAGPLGTAMGACVGISIDYLANKGIELMQRDEMIEEINSTFEGEDLDPLIPLSKF